MRVKRNTSHNRTKPFKGVKWVIPHVPTVSVSRKRSKRNKARRKHQHDRMPGSASLLLSTTAPIVTRTRKHKTHRKWQSDRLDGVLKHLFPNRYPAKGELSGPELREAVRDEYARRSEAVHDEDERRKWKHPPSLNTIKRHIGWLND
jgi:hypothetical protein